MDTSGALRPRQDFEFEGRPGSFLGLAAANLLLTIVTVGIYRFWAKTRVRRYLWSHTRFAGDPLEYRGTGLELLVGAVLALLIVVLPLFGLSTLFQTLIAQGQYGLAGFTYVVLMVGLMYIVGVGIYRSQRYLLSRTAWRGIRGGMEAGGWSFGLKYLGLGLLQVVTLGFATPYTSVRTWNLLVNDARFGSFAFQSDAAAGGLYPRFIFSLIASLMLIGGAMAAFVAIFGGVLSGGITPGPEMIGTILALYAMIIAAFFGAALIMAGYKAAFMRRVFEATSLDGLRFGLDVGAGSLIRFYLVNAAIIVLTLGLGIVFMPFRTWNFYLERLRTSGALDAETLLQTSLQGPRQGDGIADAFDLSAI